MTKNHVFLSIILLFSLSMMLPSAHAEETVNPANSTTIATPAEPATVPAPTEPVAAATAPASTAAATPTTEQAPASTSTTTAKKDEKSKDGVPEGKTLAARVVWVKGSFSANMPGSADIRALKKADNIYMNDTLMTDTDSEAQIVFTDNSTMTFRPETKFYINEYNYSPKTNGKAEKKSAGKYVMDLVTGGFRTITGLIAKENPNDYQVNTPVATIGVRGTEYSIVYKTDTGLYIKRYKGTPCMSNGAGAGSKGETKKGGGDGATQKKDVCLDAQKQYGHADENTGPVAMVQQPEVFRTDVEVVPFDFNGFGSGSVNNQDGSSSSFCIQ